MKTILIGAGLLSLSLLCPLAPDSASQRVERGLHSELELAVSRQNIARYEWAKNELKRGERLTDRWMAMSDEQLRALVAPPEVGRANEVHANGCPVHGETIYRFGRYPWIVSLDTHWKLKCPVGGETYPSNDFGAYLKSDLKDRSTLTGDYPDDGRGWRKGTEGQKYWFVAYYNQHVIWKGGIFVALRYLGRMYLLTGEDRYAHKAAVLLLRIAEFYPDYDYGPQSRYGTEVHRNYRGKLLDSISETHTATVLAAAYDAVFPSLRSDRELQRASGMDGEQIASRIEARILREAAHHVMVTGKIRGNFGMHQEALLTIALALRDKGASPTRQEMIQWVLEGQAAPGVLNVNDALYNLIFRDGVPEESPTYNAQWVYYLTRVAKLLKRTGIDLFSQPKFRRLYDWPLDMTVLGRLTPALGDSGNMFAERVGWSPIIYREAFRIYGDPRYAHVAMLDAKVRGDDEIFVEPIDEPMRQAAVKIKEAPGFRSRLFPAYGFATLQTGGEDGVAATLTFSQYHFSHRHRDFLDLGVYAMGKALTPDFGYPETANGDDPRRFGFFSSTVAHNTVMVDARAQEWKGSYRLHAYDRTAVLKRMDVSAPGAYAGKTRAYRRCVAMVPLRGNRAYLVDFFHVAGGRQHDWLIHGSQASFHSPDLVLPPAAEGTVAGSDVPYGKFYDAPEFEQLKDGARSYLKYGGSGFQFLTEPQRVESTPNVYRATWRWTRDDTPANLAAWFVGERETAIVCSGRPQNRKELPPNVKFLMRRRVATGLDDLESLFTSVFEPFTDTPTIRKVEWVRPVGGGGKATGIRITLPDRVDLLLFNPEGTQLTLGDGTRLDGDMAYVSLTPGGAVASAYVSANGDLRRGAVRVTGANFGPPRALSVARVDQDRRQVVVNGTLPASVAPGQMVLFGPARSPYEIHTVDRRAGAIGLGDQEWIVARGRVEPPAPLAPSTPRTAQTAPERHLRSDTPMPNVRVGMHILDEERRHHSRIVRISGSALQLAAETASPLRTRRFLVADFGPGDPVVVSGPGIYRAVAK